MEGLNKKFDATQHALHSLEKAIQLIENPLYMNNNDLYEALRDSLIQRFEFSIDTFWKYLKAYLQEVEGLDIALASPRNVIRESIALGIIPSESLKILINCIDDRNLTSHTYNENLAEEIMLRIPTYYLCMQSILNNLQPNG